MSELEIFKQRWRYRKYYLLGISCLYTFASFVTCIIYYLNPNGRLLLYLYYIDYILIFCGLMLLIPGFLFKVEETINLKKFRMNASKYLTHPNSKVRKYARKKLKCPITKKQNKNIKN